MKSNSIIRWLYSARLDARAWGSSRLRYDEIDGHNPHDLLPLLIRSAKAADKTAAKHDEFMLSALRTAAVLVNRVGYDPNSDLHDEALNWIFESSVSDCIETAAGAIWALGDWGTPPISVRDQLERLVVSEARSNGETPNTCRALALRMLARLDREIALNYIDSPASDELRTAISYWLDRKEISPDDANLEFGWLRTA